MFGWRHSQLTVIAILAAISVVTYNGVQDRAQRSVVQSETKNIATKVELFKTANDTYPASISDCPTPSETNLCLDSSDRVELQYLRGTSGGSGYVIRPAETYEIAVLSDSQFIYKGVGEKTGGNEFMQYADLAPFIDRYGLKKYQLSFDIKSVNTSARSSVQVYFQNGSNTRYGITAQNVPVTTEYTRHTLTFTPANSNSSVSQAMLAFFGSYGTGNRPIVKNVELQLAP